ncbi:hypothetical protein EAI_14357 [Harpegnathos saltator]|uniref:Inner centromere protein ARK-binding domain-containing protein n=1 Tax=Harpegnathos saltator TaxID=610380 RepID=E2BZS3_HARSA|nr:hypothetical protein EAI_14357 [Harpegnathos saltator]
MEPKAKDSVWNIIVKDLSSIHNRHEEMGNHFNENIKNQREYLRTLFDQLSQSSFVPIVTKTPKIIRKKAFPRIETIPEDDVLQEENTATSDAQAISEKGQDADNIASGRTKRMASLKAVNNITKQSLLMNSTKLGMLPDMIVNSTRKRESQLKRKKSAWNSSDEDEGKVVSKYSKLDKDMEDKESRKKTTESEKKTSRKVTEYIAQSNEEVTEKVKGQSASPKSQHSSRSASKKSQEKEVKKENDAIISPITDVVEDSIYEDAIGKPTPIMNSTLKYSSVVSEKMLNATVVLEPLQQRKLNETVVIQKASNQWNSRENSREKTSLEKAQQSNKQSNIEAEKQEKTLDLYDELITDDESSPELKKSKKRIAKKQMKPTILSSDDDEIPNTPVKTKKEYFKEPTVLITQDTKITYKSNALFSPYAKESVKKRVEAFEQARMQSPKPVDINVPTRMTRTKTRALAAAEAEAEMKNADKNYTQILARKSLAKAKKIACLVEKQKKDNEEFKENKEQMSEKVNKVIKYDKLSTLQMPQLKVTPLSKPKIIIPMSANRLQTPSNMQNLVNHAKALTASRGNIVTTVDSFIQIPKIASKNNSAEKLEDKKRYEEDALKKRKETLRLQMEEKRRKREEKELKNKLAREAREKQELEKRQRAEKEREEKAKLAQLMLEKQREEMEKKRLAQLQRAQEKEERRKLEEQQRLQRLQEQEEAERLLAEQKRREQDAERRKEMEMRAQQHAEAMRQKNMLQATQVKYKQAANKQQGTTNYVLDSEPDDDESDDESRPKHEIPYWAQSHVRKTQLAMQRYIPEEIVYKFFDTRKCTPDLTELFHGIDRNRLKRTSSAIWKTPPRFSMMEGD